MVLDTTKTARLIDWVLAPDVLTFDQACFLAGQDGEGMTGIIRDGNVDLIEGDSEAYIEKRSLWELLEALELVLAGSASGQQPG